MRVFLSLMVLLLSASASHAQSGDGDVVTVSADAIKRESRRSGRLREGEISRAPSEHEKPFRRWWPEAKIIGKDTRLYGLTKLVLARAAVSEASWSSLQDMRLIYQVVRTTRNDGETLLQCLREHTRIVSEVWTPKTERHRWLVELNLDATYPPHFPEPKKLWDSLYRDRWKKVLRWADALLKGRIDGRPCPVPVIAWGGRCDVPGGACDDRIARSRGLIPIEVCGDTKNRGWTRPRHFTSSVAVREIKTALREGRSPEPALFEQFPSLCDRIDQLVDSDRGEERDSESEVVGSEHARELAERACTRATQVGGS